jgi:hypothetical protein
MRYPGRSGVDTVAHENITGDNGNAPEGLSAFPDVGEFKEIAL